MRSLDEITYEEWRLLERGKFSLEFGEEHHPERDAYVRALNKYLDILYSQMPSLDEMELQTKARLKVRQGQYEELYRLKSLQQPNNIIKEIQDVRLSLGEKLEKNNPYIWLCVNPGPTVTFNDFKLLVNKMITKVWIKSYVYVYEQRGINEMEVGKGFHLHAIIKRPDDKKPSHCVRELSNTFKKCCDTSNFHFFQTKFIDEDEYRRKLEYILGTKESTSENQKDLKQAMDKVFRGKYLLKPFYFLDIDIGKYAI